MLFRLHRRYAEAFGSEWRILSAWYGITHPDQLIEDYDARFRASDLHPDNWWRITEMFRQARALGGFDRLVLLRGSLYCEIARRAFEGVFLPEQVSEPFAGMDLFRTLRALKLAVAGNPQDVSARPPSHAMNSNSCSGGVVATMNLSTFLEDLRQAFHNELSAKTGWGREELKVAFECAISNTLARHTQLT
jgi:hypothetical protein